MSELKMLTGGKKVLVIGKGGREHAICWKLAQSQQVARIYALPGSYGIGQVSKCENIKVVNENDYQDICQFCTSNEVEFVVVGPEDPLANGIADILQKNGIKCFGPSKLGAQIESDKKWSKDFMIRHGIPTALYESFTDAKKAKDFIQNAPYKALVVKASGLAAGKGVVVASNKEEACAAVDEILGEKKYGSAGETLVIEELLTGEEISLLAFVDGKSVKAMLPAQDHKRLRNNDEGPNTGGMGAYCPCPLITQSDLEFVERKVLQKAVDGLREEGISYCGVLYAGLMLTPDGPKVLEFNCRFGDPETQVVLPLMESDLYEVMLACCNQTLKDISLEWKRDESAVGVVMASSGYPESSTKGCIISGLPKSNRYQLVFNSGVAINRKNELVTDGGRVLIVVALRSSLAESAVFATRLCETIAFSGAPAQFRTDISHKALKHQTLLKQSIPSLSYKDSGVDINAGDSLVQCIKPLSVGTKRLGVVGGLGGFGGLFRLNELNFKNPVLCEATNGVGSKIKLALEHQMYENIGYDLAAICTNDVLECGAEPIAFLDYIACGNLDVNVAATIVKGIANGCQAAKTALVGGETAEMPSVYDVGKYDLAGYCVGVMEEGNHLPKYEKYEEGDLLIALPSHGLHCAGFNSILTKLDHLKVDLNQKSPVGDLTKTLGEVLCSPTRVYVDQVLPLIQQGVVKAIAHITTGLLPDVQRIIPRSLEIRLDFGDLKVPEIYGWLTAKLKLSPQTLLQNLNCGIGMVLLVSNKFTAWRTALQKPKVLGVLKRRIPALAQPTQIEVRNFNEALEAVTTKFGSFGSNVLNESHHRNLQNQLNAAADLREEGVITSIGRRLTKVPNSYKDPILVIGTDGVGTKIKIAQQTNHNGTVGIDLVAMCVNDILCNGAQPFTFSSYYACGEIKRDTAIEITGGIIDGSKQAGSSLIETHVAEIPLLYKPDAYDLAGFSLGIAENNKILPKIDEINPGDILIGLPSSGVHSNGFSLVHTIMKLNNLSFNDTAPFSKRSLGEEFLRPTKIYVKSLNPLIEQGLVKALAHITGGGLIENIPRVLKKTLAVVLDAKQFNIPPVFGWLAEKGNVKSLEMQRTYNCGLGMILVIDPNHVTKVLEHLEYSERATIVGKVVERTNELEPQVVVNNFDHALKRSQQLSKCVRKRVAVLISGSGSNLQALIDASRDSSQGLNSNIVLVISNKAEVLGVKRSAAANIPCLVISHKDFKAREDFDAEMSKHLLRAKVDIVCLAGFMRVLSEGFVKQWKGRLINIHPSLLPKHPGLHVQKKALDAGDTESGCTVHFVDEGVDTGAIIVQAAVPIIKGDTEDTLSQRIHKAEHFAYPKALRLLATGTARLSKEGKTIFT